MTMLCTFFCRGQSIIIAEAASVLVEFTQLSRLTGDIRFSEAVRGWDLPMQRGSVVSWSTLAFAIDCRVDVFLSTHAG